jgi:Icc protein
MQSVSRAHAAAWALAVTTCLLAACHPFEYSPYIVPRHGPGLDAATAHGLDRLEQPEDADAPFKFAVIADIQRRFDELGAAVRKLNADTAVRFVLVAGDITQFGLQREFAWFERELDKLKVPWLTVIGNHDALGNGTAIYRTRYGPLNYTFDYGTVRFVVANTNGWEFPRTAPDFGWMEEQLAAARAESRRIIVLSHVGPYVHQLNTTQSAIFTRLMVDYGVELSVHGHMHAYGYGRLYDSALVSQLVDNIGSRNYSTLIVGDTILEERVFF